MSSNRPTETGVPYTIRWVAPVLMFLVSITIAALIPKLPTTALVAVYGFLSGLAFCGGFIMLVTNKLMTGKFRGY